MNNQGQVGIAGDTRGSYGQPFQPELTQRQEKSKASKFIGILIIIITTLAIVGVMIVSIPIFLLGMICGGGKGIFQMIIGVVIWPLMVVAIVIAILYVLKKMLEK
jgi:hypothetical protein